MEYAVASRQRTKYMRYQLTRWAVEVKGSVGRRCDVCGKSHHDTLDEHGLPISLEAHHLWSYADYHQTRLDPANGVCLCREHHRAFHDQYGYEHNTPMQYGEFRYLTRLALTTKRPASHPNLQNLPIRRDAPHRPAFIRRPVLS